MNRYGKHLRTLRHVYMVMLGWAATFMDNRDAEEAVRMAMARLCSNACSGLATPEGPYEYMAEQVDAMYQDWAGYDPRVGLVGEVPSLPVILETEHHELAKLCGALWEVSMRLDLQVQERHLLADAVMWFEPWQLKIVSAPNNPDPGPLVADVLARWEASMSDTEEGWWTSSVAAVAYANGEYHRAVGASQRAQSSTEESGHGVTGSEDHDRDHTDQELTDDQGERLGPSGLFAPRLDQHQPDNP